MCSDPQAGRNSTRNTKPKNTKHLVTDKFFLETASIDSFRPNSHITRHGASLFVLEDIDAVIKMIFIGRSPFMRHISQTHRVNLDCLIV